MFKKFKFFVLKLFQHIFLLYNIFVVEAISRSFKMTNSNIYLKYSL